VLDSNFHNQFFGTSSKRLVNIDLLNILALLSVEEVLGIDFDSVRVDFSTHS
jgi:hypothetical protein